MRPPRKPPKPRSRSLGMIATAAVLTANTGRISGQCCLERVCDYAVAMSRQFVGASERFPVAGTSRAFVQELLSGITSAQR